MRRLFSTFARGAPAIGLLLIRFVAAISLMPHAAALLHVHPPLSLAAIGLFGTSLFLIVGLWTPLWGTLIALLGLCSLIFRLADWCSSTMVATLGLALLLLGPGAFSLDARLFGWKRLEIPPKND